MDAGTIDQASLEGKTLPELKEIAEAAGVEGAKSLRSKSAVIAKITASADAKAGAATEVKPPKDGSDNG